MIYGQIPARSMPGRSWPRKAKLGRRFVVVIPPIEYLSVAGGATMHKQVTPYYDEEMETKELMQVLRAFLQVA